jgi:hypothetical protein
MKLRWMGPANLGLGAVSLVRLATEMSLHWTGRLETEFQPFALLDAVAAACWMVSGLYWLSRDPWASPLTAVAAGAAASRTLLSGILLGPRLTRVVWIGLEQREVCDKVTIAASRLLHYGIEFVYWQIALALVFRASRSLRPEGSSPGFSISVSFAGTAAVLATTQAVLFMRPS